MKQLKMMEGLGKSITMDNNEAVKTGDLDKHKYRSQWFRPSSLQTSLKRWSVMERMN